MGKEKNDALKRLRSMSESLWCGCENLMDDMIDNDFDVSVDDEEAYIAIGELHDILEEYILKFENILNK